jgi:drug/metabolite transporter (DMT)-like permease
MDFLPGHPRNETLIGEISALACGLCWAASSVITKSLSGKVEPLSLNFIRTLGASLFLWAIIPFHPGPGGLSRISAQALLFLVLSALTGMSVGDTIYIRGLRLINVTLAFPIGQSVTPLLTVVTAALFLGESVTLPFVFGTFLVLLGIYLIVMPEGTVRPSIGPLEKRGKGIGLILIATLFWTASIAFLKLGLAQTDAFLANGVRLPVSAMALMPFALLERSFPAESKGSKGRLALWGTINGILAFGVGGILFLTAVQHAGAGKTMVLTSCGPLFGLPISILFLKERVTRKILAGTVLVVTGIAFVL